MKILKICIIACSIGMFAASCSNKECATDNNEAAITAPATTGATDGTQVVAEPADTPAQRTTDAMNNNAPKESTAGKRTPGKVYTSEKKKTTATSDGPDLEASKKREGNFTHGTGAENPGR
jgi:hypothetical protein